MALQTPMSQEQMLAQLLGSGIGSANMGMPGAGGMPAPSGMPGMPALDPQLLSQALGSDPVVNPMQMASSADTLVDPGSFGDYLRRVREWKTCMASTGGDTNQCGPQPQQGNPPPVSNPNNNPLPGPAPANPTPIYSL